MPSRASVRRQAHASWVAQTFAGAVSKDHQGRWVEAEQLYKSILVLEANHLGALHNLGYLRLRQGDRDEAARILRKTLRLHPKSAEAHNSLGLVLHTSGQFLEAVACYKTALSLKPDYWMAHNNLGASLHELNRPDQAIPCYQKALTLNPRYADAHGNLGNALQSLGRIDEARRTFEAAIALAPRQASRYHSLSACKRFSAGDPYLAAMEALAAEADKLPEDDRMQLHFALAKALGDVGEHRRSLGHLLTANALKRRQLTYDEVTTLQRFERIHTVFTPGLMDKSLIHDRRGLEESSPVPIFVVGMPRSGTTLIEQILASHTKVSGAGELADFRQSADAVMGGVAYPEAVPSLSAGQLRQIGARYLAGLRRKFPGAEWVVDKMPTNFLFAGLIAQALPNARIIHTRRDPADTCLSCFSLLFKGDLPFTYDLAELGRYYRAYERLMAHWRAVLPPGVMLEMPYEGLIADLEGQARNLVAHCGLEWDPACLSFDKTDRVVLTASSAQVRQPIYRSSIGRWRPYQDMLGPLFEALGYDPASPDRQHG